MLDGLGEDGRIASIAMTLSLTARAGFGVYAASKAAVEGLTRVLARELAALAAFSPMNRVGKAEEVANVVAFLAGPEASWITGQVVRTNGGWI